MRKNFLIIFSVIITGIFWYFLQLPHPVQSTTSGNGNSGTETASASATDDNGTVSIADIRSDYGAAPDKTQEKVRILIVPGHEPGFGGTGFGDLYERDITVELGQDLRQFFQTDGSYQTFITRNTQAWDPVFADYFKNSWSDIISWVKTSRQTASSLISLQKKSSSVEVMHNKAPTDVATRLYGFTKWANENKIDLTIHIHFNNYPGHSAKIPGIYSGFVIYAPASQYSNSSTTHAIAESVFNRLSMYDPTDNLPAESAGIIDDSDLIAIGAENTSDAASMLIEYDYIYEPQFTDPKVRSLALKDLAYQTYLGVQDFFNKNRASSAADLYDPSSLYAWNNPSTGKNSDPTDIYALQTALMLSGDYPPPGKSRNDCPHSGTFGSCTAASLQSFQKKNGIAGENGFAGIKTFTLLSGIYSGKIR